MKESTLVYLDLLHMNQETFAAHRLQEAARCLLAALYIAVELEDLEKLKEILHRAEGQMQKVQEEMFARISWVELSDYNSVLELAGAHIMLLQNRLSP